MPRNVVDEDDFQGDVSPKEEDQELRYCEGAGTIATVWVRAAAQQLADHTGRPVRDVHGRVHHPA